MLINLNCGRFQLFLLSWTTMRLTRWSSKISFKSLPLEGSVDSSRSTGFQQSNVAPMWWVEAFGSVPSINHPRGSSARPVLTIPANPALPQVTAADEADPSIAPMTAEPFSDVQFNELDCVTYHNVRENSTGSCADGTDNGSRSGWSCNCSRYSTSTGSCWYGHDSFFSFIYFVIRELIHLMNNNFNKWCNL